MRPLRASAFAAALTALLVLGPSAGGARAAETLSLTLAESRAFARRALAAGQVDVARAIAIALLEADPRDAEALLLLAAAAARMGEAAAARTTAQLAFRAAATRADRYEAARLAALAAELGGRPGAAQLWLRRAAGLAPDPPARADTEREYQAVRAAAPVTTTFRFHIAPSSNINRGSRYDTLIIDGIPTPFTLSGDARALPGVEIGASAGLRWRFARGPAWQADLGGRVHHTTYRLAPAARELAPDARGRDFSHGGAEVSLRLTVAPAGGGPPLALGLTAGRSWYAEEPLATTLRLDLGQSYRLGTATDLRLDLLAERQWSDRGRKAAAWITAVQAQARRRLAHGDMLALRLTLTGLESQDRNASHRAVSGELRWELGRPVGPARVSLAVTGAVRDYPVFMSNIFNRGGRQEKTLGAALELALPAAEVWGYLPVVTLKGSRTRSNVSRFDSEVLGIEVAFRSAF